MGLFNNKLKRKEIANKLYEYRKNNDGNLEIYTYNKGFIEIIEKYINKSTFESDKDFIFGGRKKFLYNEFYDYLDNKEKHKSENPVRFAIGNLEEFICNNNHIVAEDVDKSKWKDGKIIDGKDIVELRNKNDRYSATGYICLEEKEYIVEMLNRLKKELFRSDRFTYQEGDIKIVNCLCELCSHYNNGKRSDECPKDLLDKVLNNEIKCPNVENEHSFEKTMGRINSENNKKLTRDEIDKYFNEIYAKDEDGRFKTLKFQDYKSEIDYRGKKDEELNIDEIVRLKQSYHHLHEIFDSLNISDIEAIKLVSKVLQTPFNEIIFYTSKIENNLLYTSIPVRGGGSVIIDPKTKEYLFAGSIIDFDTHLKEFKNGRRTPSIN